MFTSLQISLALIVITLFLTGIVGYANHFIWVCFMLFTNQIDTASEILLSILGTFIPPLGVVHGLYLFF